MKTRSIVTHATSEELHGLLDTMINIESPSEFQVNMLNDIAGELIKRGEMPAIIENNAQIKKHSFARETEDPEEAVRDLIQDESIETPPEPFLSAPPDNIIRLNVLTEELPGSEEEAPAHRELLPDTDYDPEGVLREVLLSGKTKDLVNILHAMFRSDNVLVEQAPLLYDITEELRRRGVRVPYEDGELWQRYTEIMQDAETVDEHIARVSDEILTRGEPLQRPPKKKRRFPRVAGIVAATVCCLLIADTVAYSAGVSLLGTVSAWMRGVVHIDYGGYEQEPPAVQEQKDGYTSLKETLELLDIHVDLPAYMPEGFTLQKIEPTDPSVRGSITAWFENGDKAFSIHIANISSNLFYEVNPNENSEQYKEKFTIMYNIDHTVAVWAEGYCQFSLQGDLTGEEVKLILDSIQ